MNYTLGNRQYHCWKDGTLTSGTSTGNIETRTKTIWEAGQVEKDRLVAYLKWKKLWLSKSQSHIRITERKAKDPTIWESGVSLVSITKPCHRKRTLDSPLVLSSFYLSSIFDLLSKRPLESLAEDCLPNSWFRWSRGALTPIGDYISLPAHGLWDRYFIERSATYHSLFYLTVHMDTAAGAFPWEFIFCCSHKLRCRRLVVDKKTNR